MVFGHNLPKDNTSNNTLTFNFNHFYFVCLTWNHVLKVIPTHIHQLIKFCILQFRNLGAYSYKEFLSCRSVSFCIEYNYWTMYIIWIESSTVNTYHTILDVNKHIMLISCTLYETHWCFDRYLTNFLI